jgi:hypothetical protein
MAAGAFSARQRVLELTLALERELSGILTGPRGRFKFKCKSKFKYPAAAGERGARAF